MTAWQDEMTQLIAGRIRETRRSHRMRAQDLADACSTLGLHVTRGMIAKLENGSRGHITIPEVLVLARALGVSPLSLLLPPDAPTEVTPGVTLDADAARAWFVGTEPPRTITITVPAGAEVRMTS